jgi:O-antigen ligase
MNTISVSPQDGSAQGRLMAWGAAVRMAADNPIFGVGAGHFPVMFGTTYKPAGVGQIPWLTAHSIYFLVLGELGLPGIAFLLTFIIWNLRANRQLAIEIAGQDSESARTASRLLAALSATMLAYAVGGAFLSALYYPHVFVLAGLMVTGRRIVRTELRKATAPQSAAVPRTVQYHPAIRPVLGAAAITRRPSVTS